MALLPRDERARDCLTIFGVALLFAAIVRPFQNAPFVDDWVYAWSVENLLTHGRVQVLNYSDNVNVAQIVWGALACVPFGFSFTALRVSTWLLGIVSLCALYLLLRELEVSRRDALLGAATLAVYPVFALLTITFMTDVPFLSMTMLTSAAIVRAVRTRSTGWLWGAALAACLAVGIRAVGVVAPIAMVLFLVLRRDGWGRARGRWLVALAPLVLFAVLYSLRSQVFHGGDVGWLRGTTPDRLALLREFALPLLPRMLAGTFALAVGVLGLALLPLTIACLGRTQLRRTLSIAAAIGAVLAVLSAIGVGYPLPLTAGGIWSLGELGGSSVLVPDYSPRPVPPALSWSLLVIATVSSAAAVNAMWRRRGWWSGDAFLLWSIAGHGGLMALTWLVYDRYALVLVPYAIALVLAARPRIHVPVAVGAIAMLAIITGVAMRDHLSYNAALWNAVAILERSGVPERDINGGYMVNGWLQYAHPERAHRNPEGQLDIPWVTTKSNRPYKIANRVSPGWREVTRLPYERWLGASGYIYALKLLASPSAATAPPREPSKVADPNAGIPRSVRPLPNAFP
jgi:Dolichyl-phosphate-mannose-protein mannosyltransferase